MPNHMTNRWKWAAGAALALMASASMADTSASLQQLTPNGNWSWDGLLGMQDGSSTLTLSSDLSPIHATLYGAAIPPMGTPGGGMMVNTPVTTWNTYSIVNGPSNAVYEIGSTGGLTLSSSIAIGGTLTITDLSVNFGTKLISATLIGGHGLGTVQNVPIWTVDNISSTVVGCPDNGGMCDAGGYGAPDQPQHRLDTMSTGLHLTAQGNQAFRQAMGWIVDAPPDFDFGTLSTSTMFLSSPALHAVPEPGTWMLMGMGLIGLFGLRRHRAH